MALATLAGRLDPRRLCRFDGKPHLLAELAEAAAFFWSISNGVDICLFGETEVICISNSLLISDSLFGLVSHVAYWLS